MSFFLEKVIFEFMGNSYIGALLAIIAFGSYMVPLRRYPAFSSYASLAGLSVGVLFVSFIIALITGTLSFNLIGFLCGILWVFGGALCFSAVHKEANLSGTSVRMMGACILISFLSGVLILHETIIIWLALVAILAIGCGLLLISPQKGQFFKKWRSLVAGSIFGVHLLPFQLAQIGELEFAFSYALGIFLAAILLFCFIQPKEKTPVKPIAPWILSFLAGALWLIGTHGSFWAIDPEGPLGFGIGYPLAQMNLLVNIAWGVFAFKEYPTWKERLRLGSAALVILCGAVLLTLSKILVGN